MTLRCLACTCCRVKGLSRASGRKKDESKLTCRSGKKCRRGSRRDSPAKRARSTGARQRFRIQNTHLLVPVIPQLPSPHHSKDLRRIEPLDVEFALEDGRKVTLSILLGASVALLFANKDDAAALVLECAFPCTRLSRVQVLESRHCAFTGREMSFAVVPAGEGRGATGETIRGILGGFLVRGSVLREGRSSRQRGEKRGCGDGGLAALSSSPNWESYSYWLSPLDFTRALTESSICRNSERGKEGRHHFGREYAPLRGRWDGAGEIGQE